MRLPQLFRRPGEQLRDAAAGPLRLQGPRRRRHVQGGVHPRARRHRGGYALSAEERDKAGGRERVAVAVRAGRLLATAFHPELTSDLRWCGAGAGAWCCLLFCEGSWSSVGLGGRVKLFCFYPPPPFPKPTTSNPGTSCLSRWCAGRRPSGSWRQTRRSAKRSSSRMPRCGRPPGPRTCPSMAPSS